MINQPPVRLLIYRVQKEKWERRICRSDDAKHLSATNAYYHRPGKRSALPGIIRNYASNGPAQNHHRLSNDRSRRNINGTVPFNTLDVKFSVACGQAATIFTPKRGFRPARHVFGKSALHPPFQSPPPAECSHFATIRHATALHAESSPLSANQHVQFGRGRSQTGVQPQNARRTATVSVPAGTTTTGR